MTDLAPQTIGETVGTDALSGPLAQYRLPNLFERFSKRYGLKDARKVERMFQKQSPGQVQPDQKHYANSIAVAKVLPPRMFSSAITEAFSDPYGVGPSKKLSFTDIVILPPLPSPTTLHGHFAHPVAITAASGLTINQQKQYEMHHPVPSSHTIGSGGKGGKTVAARKKSVQIQRRGLEKFSEMPRSVMWALTPKTRIVEVYGGGLPHRRKPVNEVKPATVTIQEDETAAPTSSRRSSIIPMIQLNDDELIHTGVSLNTISEAGSPKTGTLESLASDLTGSDSQHASLSNISRKILPKSINLSRFSLVQKSQADLSMKRSTSMRFASNTALSKPEKVTTGHSGSIQTLKQTFGNDQKQASIDNQKHGGSMQSIQDQRKGSQSVPSKDGSMLVLNPLPPKVKVPSIQNLKSLTNLNRASSPRNNNIGLLSASNKLGNRSSTSINNLASLQQHRTSISPSRTSKASNGELSKQRRKSVRPRIIYNPNLEDTFIHRTQNAEIDRIMERMSQKGVELDRNILERALMLPEDVLKKAISDEPVRNIRRRRKTRVFNKMPMFTAAIGGKTIRQHHISQESLIEDLSRTLLPGETVYDILSLRRLLRHRRNRQSDNEPTEEELFAKFCQALVAEMEDGVESEVVAEGAKQVIENILEEIAQEKARKEAEAAAKAEAERLEKERLEKLAAEKAAAEEAMRKPDPIPVFVDKIIASLVQHAYPKPPSPKVEVKDEQHQEEENAHADSQADQQKADQQNEDKDFEYDASLADSRVQTRQESVRHVRTVSIVTEAPLMIADEFTSEIDELLNLQTSQTRLSSRKTTPPKPRPISSRQKRIRAKTLTYWTEQEYKKLRKKYAKYHLDKADGVFDPKPPTTPEWTDKIFTHPKLDECATGIKKRIMPRARSQSMPQPTRFQQDSYVPSTLLNLVDRAERTIRDSSAREFESIRRQTHYTQTGDFEIYRLYNYHL